MLWVECLELARQDWASACREARRLMNTTPVSGREMTAKIRFFARLAATRCGNGLGWVACFNFSHGGDVKRAEARRQYEQEQRERRALASRPLPYGTWSKGTPG